MQAGKFEKVSFGQFLEAMKEEFDFDGAQAHDVYDRLRLPIRATEGSAGYDLKSPFPFELAPGESIKIPSGIRAKIDVGWWLACVPRSGLGFKYKARLANTVGVIDSDYYGSSNEGHIFIKICNEGDKSIKINAGDGVIQMILVPFGITYNDESTGVRDGGFGSTGA